MYYLTRFFLFANILISSLSLNFENYIGYKDFTYCGYSKKYAHLSFDDGPNKNLNGADTLKILDVLDELNIKASFFLLGKNIYMYPYIAQEIVKRGHTVGSHSWTHRDMTNIPIYEAVNEFSKSSSVFKEILGVNSKYYRPPYGNINQNLMKEIKFQTGMDLVMWNMDLNDWRIVQDKNPKNWAINQLDYVQKVMISSLKSNNTPSSMIILAHDIRSTQDMIRNVVKYFKSLGYVFVDLDTCYKNWLIDKKPESPCVNDFNNITTDGTITVSNKCTQLASGLPLNCIPNGNLCILNKCGSPGCGLSCDNRNLCVNNTFVCKPNCLNKMCGDDGCGNSCGMCGSDCQNGVCIKPIIPDISKINLCRPFDTGKLEIKPIKNDYILVNYNITAQWDNGMVIVYTITNNYKDIEKFIIKIYTDSFVIPYGANIHSVMQGSWIELELDYISYNTKALFTIELSINSISDAMKMCCAPTSIEISCLQINNVCIDTNNLDLISENKLDLRLVNNSFKITNNNYYFILLIILNILYFSNY
jgi:peptidoglycan/xylan/chitin deacetylase (PgdA/CDA1 family)